MARPGSLVTVFGGSGFLGAQVVRALLRADHRVRIAVRNPNLAFESQTQGRVGQIQRVACDVTDESQVAAALEGATAAVNLVGILFETPWRRFETMHAEAPERIARASVSATASTPSSRSRPSAPMLRRSRAMRAPRPKARRARASPCRPRS